MSTRQPFNPAPLRAAYLRQTRSRWAAFRRLYMLGAIAIWSGIGYAWFAVSLWRFLH